MIIPQYDGKNNPNVPNHQPDMGLSERVYPQVATLIGKIITRSLTNPFMGYTIFRQPHLWENCKRLSWMEDRIPDRFFKTTD